MGIEDEHEWIRVNDDCPPYECLAGTDIVKNVLNASVNESFAKNDDNDDDKDDDPPPHHHKK